MSRKPYKHKKKGAGRFVQLSEWVQATEAWATLKPGPRALYVELKRRFNGHNNGQILLSHRDAAKALNVHRNTVGGWFDELEARGFIFATRGHCLGPSGIGETTHWALGEEPTADMQPARKAFVRWGSEKKPRTENRPARHKDEDGNGNAVAVSSVPVLKIVT